jgi:hypothetical protein
VRRPLTAAERAEIGKNKPQWNCRQCVFCVSHLMLWARTLLSGFPMMGQCANHPDTPGQIRPVPGPVCRNFRPKTTRTQAPGGVQGKIAYIPLTRDLQVMVDAEDYEWLNHYRWHANPSKPNGTIYAARCVGHRSVLMHRMIMNPPPGMVVDHINGNGLDNRRCNLRIVPPAVNAQNRRKRAGGKSRFIGVYPRGKKWWAVLGRQYLGTFDDEVEAAKARDRKAREMYGEHAWLNFPPEPEAGPGRGE